MFNSLPLVLANNKLMSLLCVINADVSKMEACLITSFCLVRKVKKKFN